MTVRWKYFEKDAYKQAWVKFNMSNGLMTVYEAREALKEYHAMIVGWELMFETEQDLQFFLLKWS